MTPPLRPPLTAATLDGLLHDPATVLRELKRDGSGVVTLHEADGERWIVKRETRPTPVMRLYHLLRCSSAWRQWRGAERLRVAGVRINEPATLVHEGRGVQTLVLPYVEGVNLHDWLGTEHSGEVRRRVARAIGSQIGRITKTGWINRDHKPTNLMIDAACEQAGEQPVLIDLAGIRKRRNTQRALGMFHVMMRAVRRTGPVSLREQLTVVKAAIAEDPTLGRNATDVARIIGRMAAVRPLSYDPNRGSEAAPDKIDP